MWSLGGARGTIFKHSFLSFLRFATAVNASIFVVVVVVTIID